MKRTILAMLSLAISAQAEVVTTSLQTSFTDKVLVSTSSTQTELVPLAGRVFTLTQVTVPPSPIIPPSPIVPITVTTVGVATGVGQSTGTRYVAFGASQVQGTVSLPGAFSYQNSLRISPNSPPIVPPNPVTLQAAVAVNSQGTATAASVMPLGLVSLWKGEGNAADALGNNPGTLQETVNFVAGKVGMAFNFPSAGFVEVAASPTLQPAAVTAMAWVRHPGVPGPNNYVLSQGAKACSAASYALYTSTGNLFFGVSDGVTFAQTPDAGPGVWDGNWHLVAGTYDGAVARLYVDGAEVTPGTPTPIPIAINNPLPTNQNFYIGAYRGTCELRFAGDIDEVRVFNRALSAVGIKSILAGTP